MCTLYHDLNKPHTHSCLWAAIEKERGERNRWWLMTVEIWGWQINAFRDVSCIGHRTIILTDSNSLRSIDAIIWTDIFFSHTILADYYLMERMNLHSAIKFRVFAIFSFYFSVCSFHTLLPHFRQGFNFFSAKDAFLMRLYFKWIPNASSAYVILINNELIH